MFRGVLEHLSERKPPLRFNLLDTIALDRLTTVRPLFWLYTSSDGYLQSRNVRNVSTEEVVQSAVAGSVSAKVPRYLVNLEESKETLAVGICDTARFPLTTKALLSLPEMFASGLDGLVLVKVPGKKFDRRVFIHEIRVQGSVCEDAIKARSLSDLSLKELGAEQEIRSRVKSASVHLIERLQDATRLNLQQITLLYRYEVLKREAWLLSLDDCLLSKPRSSDTLHRGSVATISITVEPCVRPPHGSPVLPRTASRFFKQPHKSNKLQAYGQTQRTLFRWGKAMDNTGGSALCKMTRSQSQSQNESQSIGEKTDLPSSSKPLRTNESAFRAVAFRSERQRPVHVSKLNESYSGKFLQRDSSLLGWEESYAPVQSGAKCWGAFCEVPCDMSQSRYTADARFLVSQQLIESMKTAHPPARVQSPKKERKVVKRRHKKAKSEGLGESLAVNKLVARGETVLLPVCVRCFAVYEDLKAVLGDTGKNK